MKIEDIYNITGGSAVNTPQITAVNFCSVFPSKIREGDLFFAARKEDIDSAVANGAYAVVYEGDDPSMTDRDIAWIKTDSVKEAAFRYLRYALLGKEADFYLLTPHETSFLKMVLTHKKNIVFLPGDWAKAFESVLNSKEHLFVGEDKEMLRTITPEWKCLDEAQDWYMISDTIFRSTFKTEGYVYQSMEIAPFHLEDLMKAVRLCTRYDMPYSFDRLRYTRHFVPVFVDGQLRAVPKGSSSKVVVFVDNTDDIVKAREYIRHQNAWVKSIVLTPPKTKIEGLDRPYWFETHDEALKILRQTHFNYAFVLSLEKNMLKNIREEYTLF